VQGESIQPSAAPGLHKTGSISLLQTAGLRFGRWIAFCPPCLYVSGYSRFPSSFARLPRSLNFAFDSRDLLTLWLVGLPHLARRLHMQQHAALRTRVTVEIRLEPLDRETFVAAIEHGLKPAGASQKIVADQAMEMLFRSSRGILRVASKTLRTAIRIAADRGQSFLDEPVLQAALDDLGVGTS